MSDSRFSESAGRYREEFDVVRIDGALLHLDARPAHGFMCDPASRPALADAPPLVRID